MTTRRTILVVDDEPGIRDLLAWELQRLGDTVVTAGDGEQGILEIGRATFDVIITDVVMPKRGGIDVLRAARAQSPGTEVIVTTGHASLDIAVACVKAGAFDFVTKPFEIADLLGVVDRAAARGRERHVMRELASLGRSAAEVVHEIKNPLTYVKANLDFLLGSLGEKGSAELLAALNEASDGTDRIAKIVHDMSGLGRTPTRRDPIDVTATLRIALRMAAPRLPANVSVRESLPPTTTVLGDGHQLTQVFLNLVVNASQALGTANGIITVKVDRQGSSVVAEICDSGPGMSPAVLARTFEPLFTTKPPGEGTGLGLALCKRLVEGMGGTIAIASAPGQGTTVTIRLPAAHKDAAYNESRAAS